MTDMTLVGGAGDDPLDGGADNDTFTGNGGNDVLNGYGGTDTAIYAGPIGNYSITMTTNASGRVVAFNAVGDNEPGDGDEGFDTLNSIERLQFSNRTLDLTQGVQLFDQNDNLLRTFSTIQEAIDVAQNNYTIRVAAGDFDEDLVIDVGVTIIGAAPTAVSGRDAAGGVGETNITGESLITSTGNVVIDGVRFVNDATTTGGPVNATLRITTGGSGDGHEIVNSIFWSSVAGGPNAVGDRAISISPIASGTVTIADNLISGSAQGLFDTASWNRAIWFDGGGVALNVTGNTIEWSRTGLNLDMFGSSTASVTGNTFRGLGSGISVGYDTDGLTIANNDHQQVGSDFNLRNLAGPVTFDADAAIDTLTPSDAGNDLIFVLGGSGGDDLTGTAHSDVLDGNNLNFTATDSDELHGAGGIDLLLGRGGNDTLDGGADNDSLDGGAGVDTATVSGLVSITPNGADWTVVSADGTDTLVNVEIVPGAGTRTLLVGSGGFATIQAAVNAAQDGDTILVAGGTYIEQVVVNNLDNLTIRAFTGAQVTIQAPADVVETARSISDREIHSVFTVKDSSNVQLVDIDIDGAGAGNTVDEAGGAGQANFYGVFYRNSSGGLTNVDVEHVRDQLIGGQVSGVQRGVGVVVDNDSLMAFTMTGGSISDFQKNATVFNGADLTVTGVTITGAGATPTIAQNGIQALNSTGTIAGNEISDIGYSGGGGAYSGAILLFGNTDLDVTGNTIVGANDGDTAARVVGIWVFQSTFAPNTAPSSGGEISGNDISYVDEGIDVSGDLTPDGILIQNNDVTDIDGSDNAPLGVWFEPDAAFATAYDVDGTAADDYIVGGAGADHFSGLDGNDDLTGGGGNDTLEGGALDHDTANYSGARAGYSIVVETNADGMVTGFTGVTDTNAGNGDDGTDGLTSIESLRFADVTLDVDQPVQLFNASNALVGTFGTIQAAVDAAQDGYSILLAAGTYAGDTVVDVDVTILGANDGISGSGVRGAESILSGTITIAAAGVTIDGVQFSGESSVSGPPWPVGVNVTAAGDDLTIVNSVFDTDYSGSGDIVGLAASTVDGLSLSDNLFHGYSVGVYITSGSTGSINDNVFQGDWSAGDPDNFFGMGNGVNSESSSLLIADNTFNALYGASINVLADGPASLDLDTFVSGNSFVDGRPAQSIQIFPNGIVDTVTGTDQGERFRGADGSASGPFHVLGEGGDDNLTGSGAGDILSGGDGNDRLDGAGGNDILVTGDGSDVLYGGSGFDTALLSTNTALVDTPIGWISLSADGNDFLDGVELAIETSGQRNLLVGATGFASVNAATVSSLVQNGDFVRLAAGTYSGSASYNNSGLVVLAQAATLNATFSSPGNFGITIFAGNSVDTITTGGGNDVIDGGGGADTMAGGLGDDWYHVGSAGDTVVEGAAAGANDRVLASVNYTLGAGVHVEHLTTNDDAAATAINLTGNEFAQTIQGNAGANVLDGAGGNDTLVGLGGNDVYHVDAAGDVVQEAAASGSDTVYAGVTYTLTAGQEIEALSTNDAGATTAINLTGNAFGQTITGNAGANVLNGAAGSDTLVGLGGNDIYHVDASGDVVQEAASSGTDVVYAGVSYTLTAGAEVETLSTSSQVATTAINLVGNEFGQTIYGNAGANILNGLGGNDALVGLGGNDIYQVDAAGDAVYEAAGGGTDVVYASASYTLTAGQEVETLSSHFQAGVTAINLTGNALGQTIYGNAGANVLNGGGGDDALVGLGGNDIYHVDSASDAVYEAAAGGTDVVYTGVSYTLTAGQEVETFSTSLQAGFTAIDLTGNALGQTIYGNAGTNVLDGKGGNDVLVGLAGTDTFAFTTALGAGNVDSISGFSVADDTIQLENAVFTGLAGGALAVGAFNTGAAATEADDRIIYNTATGALLFDADGSGAGAAVQFATLATGLAMTSSDFLVI